MKQILHSKTLFCLALISLLPLLGQGKWAMKAVAQTFSNAAATVTWPYNGSLDEAVTTPEGAFSLSSFTLAGGLKNVSSQAYDGITFTRFEPLAKSSSAADDATLIWKVRPSKGVTFTPTRVSANICRFGTGGGLLDIKVRNSEGQETTLATGVKPRRNGASYTDGVASFSYDVDASFATQGDFEFIVYLYSLDAKKQVGFNNVKIEGTVNGEKQSVAQYTFQANVSPEGAATITQTPAGNTFDQGTEIRLNAAKNFGHNFLNWTNAAGDVVSVDADFTYTLNADAVLTANFAKVNTYSLAYSVSGGANDYMVQPDPKPTVVEGKNMYEEGTLVTLTATGNPILTFNSWSNGETSSQTQLTMDGDKTINADFSAKDFIVAWDFYKESNNGRVADFFAEENDADQLVLRSADGTTFSWLDKSQMKVGGYEGRPAAVNWCTSGLGEYYWQTKFNAAAFTDVKVQSAMTFNYNAYSKYDVEYYLDNATWEKIGTFSIPGAKQWVDETFSLPAAANNQATVYLRWIADKTSDVLGTQSNNDGIALGAVYITGTKQLVDDGTAPVLQSFVPEEASTTASINGKIVLNFDEKVKLAQTAKATLNDMELSGEVSGKSVLFAYKNLKYNTPYTFTLPQNSVTDFTDNALATAITIHFTTRTRPEVTKALYDFIVPDQGTVLEAIQAANQRSDKQARYRIFIKKGSYQIPASATETKEGIDGKTYPSATTTLSAANVSIIGEDIEFTDVRNTVPAATHETQYGPANVLEGIGRGDVLLLQKTATNTYFQDITWKSDMADNMGRNIVFNDQSDKTVCKNVCLWAYQDTYVSNNQNGRFYFEGVVLRGRTDYLCGKGDVFYNAVTLQNCAKGGYLAVPSQPKQYGYVFRDCTIKGETNDIDGNYTLGRPWGQGTPIALFIDTKMEVKPSAIGWSEMSGGWANRMAEYNSTTSTGTVIDLSTRKTEFGAEGDKHPNNPILTKEEADQLTIATVMGQDDDWDPAALAEQAPAPENVKISNGTMTWDNSNYALLWAVVKDGNVVAFTLEPTYEADATSTWAVRAANEMGGLSEAVEAVEATGISVSEISNEGTTQAIYTVSGTKTNALTKGVNIVVKQVNGKKQVEKIIVR